MFWHSRGKTRRALRWRLWLSRAYRSGALSAYQARRLLGFETRYELDGLLKMHNTWEHATVSKTLSRIVKP
jgi:hypothetical protein